MWFRAFPSYSPRLWSYFSQRDNRKIAKGTKPKTSRRPSFEYLETRNLPSVNFGSAFAIGPTAAGNYGESWGRHITSDTAGNVYVTGLFAGSVDFDPLNVHADNSDLLQSLNNTDDVFVAKYSSSGAFQWARRMGSASGSDWGEGVAVDGVGNVYVVGVGSGDFGPFTLSGTDVFVEKLDAGGSVLWAKGYTDHPYNDSLQDIAVDGSGNVYVTHSDNLTNTLINPNVDVFVTRLDPGTGNTVWSDQFGSSGIDTGRGIKADAAGNVYVTGTFTGSVDFDPGPGTLILSTGKGKRPPSWSFVLKLNTNGGVVWADALPSATSNDLALDTAGNVYTTGSFGGTADFNPGKGTFNLTSAGSEDVFVSKLDTNGNFVWAKSMGGADHDVALGIAVDGSSNVYTTGYYGDAAGDVSDFDPGAGVYNLTSAGNRDIFISKLDASGNFAYAAGIGSSGADEGFGIAVDPSNNIYTTGLFNGTVDFDPSPTSTFFLTAANLTNSREAFVLELTQSSPQLPAGGVAPGGAAAAPSTGSAFDPSLANALASSTISNSKTWTAPATGRVDRGLNDATLAFSPAGNSDRPPLVWEPRTEALHGQDMFFARYDGGDELAMIPALRDLEFAGQIGMLKA
jgi:hypothetical protein